MPWALNNPDLFIQYDKWMKKYPENVNIPLAIGSIFYGRGMPQAKGFLLKAAAMDPQNPKIWYMLAADADMGMQNELFTAYIGKAASLEPSNASYAYGYLRSIENSDPSTYNKKVFDFAKRFPADERGAQAIYSLGARATNANDKIHYFEELRKLYPPQKFAWSESGMNELADAYMQNDPKKALVLISEMDSKGGDWHIRKEVAESLIKIDRLQQEQKFKDAVGELDQVKLPRLNYIGDLISLKKAALLEKLGNVKTAYDTLTVRFAKLPTDALYSAVELYGKKIGNDKEQVDADIEMIRNKAANPAYPFVLGLYTSNEKLDLQKLKGKVVLLTFWFPGCLPCREEFPHFQTVVNSFKGDSLIYLGINVIPSQDGYVLPFLESTKYSFIPLRGTVSFASQKYGVEGQPENFLIDKDGNIIFKDFRIDSLNHRTLELMISSLLKKGSSK